MFVLQTYSLERNEYGRMISVVAENDIVESIQVQDNKELAVFQVDSTASLDLVLQFVKVKGLSQYLILTESMKDFFSSLDSHVRHVAARVDTPQKFDRIFQRHTEFEWVWISSPDLLTKEVLQRIHHAGLKIIYTDTTESTSLPSFLQQKSGANAIMLDAVCCNEGSISLWKTYLQGLKRESGILTYHQGWTDIINSAAFISYYARRYKKLYLCIREDTVDLHSFLTSQFPNVIFVKGPPSTWYEFLPEAVEKICDDPSNKSINSQDRHIIGILDDLRTDSYKRVFRSLEYETEFWLKFYSAYNISYSVSINYFDILRNHRAEDELYNKVVKTQSYNVVHLTERSNLQIPTEEELQIRKYECYELHQISPHMFDAIKILQNAKGIYLIDSLWAAICYHLDAKYRLFSHIPVTVYCLRNYKTMFTKPVNLPNWQVKVDLT